ncbi:MAG TPA: CBS domain-containing protein [Thermodesulfobacteriota bacterium]
MRVKDFMTQNPLTVSPLDNIQNTFQVLINNGIHQVPVVSNGDLVGIVTDRDLRMALAEDIMDAKVNIGTVMSKNPVSVTDDLKIVEAAKIIRKRRFNALPVINKKGELVGIVTVRDILDGLINLFEISK